MSNMLPQDDYSQFDHLPMMERLQQISAVRHEAEIPVLEDLRRHGFVVDRLDLLYKMEGQLDAFAPILLRWLNDGQLSDATRWVIVRAFDGKRARPWWNDLVELYLKPNGPRTKDVLASALAQTVTKQTLDEYIRII